PEAAKPALPSALELPKWMTGVMLGGGALLWYYQPIKVPSTENNVSLYFANLLIDGKWGAFGLHVEPRFRDTKIRPFYDGPAWVEEAYGSVEAPPNSGWARRTATSASFGTRRSTATFRSTTD